MTSVLSQVLNSGGNIAVTVLVARSSTVTEFGAWALGYAFFIVATSAARAVSSTPQILRSGDGDALSSSPSGALSLAAGVGALIGLAAGVTVSLTGNPVLGIVFSVLVPLGCLHDAVRYWAIGQLRPGSALLVDATWTGVQALGFLALSTSQNVGAVSLTLDWGLGLVMSCSLGIYLFRPRFGFSVARRFYTANRWMSHRLAVDTVIMSIQSVGVVGLLGSLYGLQAVGAFRAGQTLLGGMNLVVSGLAPAALAIGSRHVRSGGGVVPVFVAWAVPVSILGALYGALLLSIPPRVGSKIFGETWELVAAVLLPFALQPAVRGPVTGIQVALQASRRLNAALLQRSIATAILVCSTLGGSVLFGVEGAAWGLFLGTFGGSLSALVYSCLSQFRTNAIPKETDS